MDSSRLFEGAKRLRTRADDYPQPRCEGRGSVPRNMSFGVIFADDEPIIRFGMREIISAMSENPRIRGEAGSGQEVLDLADKKDEYAEPVLSVPWIQSAAQLGESGVFAPGNGLVVE